MRACLLVLLLFATSIAGKGRGGGGGGGRSYGGGGHSSGGGHGYPHSNGYSGTGSGSRSHSYPGSTGLSGNSRSSNTNYYHHQQKNEVHHHYHYSPPQQVSYGSGYHPVYHGAPPVYVYTYRDSGSRYDNLLTGLALYNLGRMSGSSHHSSSDDHYRKYSGISGEICKLGIQNGASYEETRIDCELMSSFIWDSSLMVSDVVTTVPVTDPLHEKGSSITVIPGMSCFVIRVLNYTTMKKKIDCGLLQEYSRSSLRRNGSERLNSWTYLPLILCTFVFVSY